MHCFRLTQFQWCIELIKIIELAEAYTGIYCLQSSKELQELWSKYFKAVPHQEEGKTGPTQQLGEAAESFLHEKRQLLNILCDIRSSCNLLDAVRYDWFLSVPATSMYIVCVSPPPTPIVLISWSADNILVPTWLAQLTFISNWLIVDECKVYVNPH